MNKVYTRTAKSSKKPLKNQGPSDKTIAFLLNYSKSIEILPFDKKVADHYFLN